MSIRSLRAGRGLYDASTYTGTKGEVFYNEATGEFRRCDAVTPGGIPIPITLATSTTAGSVKPNNSFSLDPADGTLSLLPATDIRIGGVKLGPGVVTNAEGQIIIDSEGLEFSFGDFAAIDNVLQTINPNQDAIFKSNGTGAIRAVGEMYVHPTNGDIEDYSDEPYLFGVGSDGQVKIYVPTPDDTAGAVEIIGSLSGITQTPVNTGVMLHITGQNDDPARLYIDAIGGYAGWIGRRFNGQAIAPTQILANEEVTRFGSNAYKTGGWSGVGGSNIRFIATDNQTDTAQGMKIDFYSTPQGSPTSAIVKIMTLDGGLGIETPKLVKARNYEGQARDAGTLGAAGTLTIDFATDHNVLVNLTTTAVIAFSNITAGKTVTVLVKNTSGVNRAVTLGVAAENTSGGNAAPNVNNNRTGVFVYRSFGTTAADVYCEVN